MLPGVYFATRKNGDKYYRASITYKNRHISLGSYECEEHAFRAYTEAGTLLSSDLSISDYIHGSNLSFEKWVILVNFRDNDVYFSNPIYLRKKTFNYYLSPELILTFDAEDLFYYAGHKIQKRGDRLFVADYGMQVTLNTRYGIKPYAVEGRDYRFVNGDNHDYRYENIIILSRYTGVFPVRKNNIIKYKVRIHVRSTYSVGYYDDETSAAIAYNKAADILIGLNIKRNYGQNFIEELPAKDYADIYFNLDLSDFQARMKSRFS